MRIKYYLQLITHVFSFYLKSALEYRFNFFMRILYGPAYTVVLFLLLAIAYSQTNILVGWTREEAFLLFGVFHFIYALAIIGFVESVKFYLWEGFSNGDFDTIMLKPANTQFLATFLRPEINQIPLTLGMLALIIHQFAILHLSIFSWPFVLFVLSLVVSFCIIYFFISTLMTIGFYVVRGAQMYEFFDKVTDNGTYPMPLFPSSIQLIFFTLLPIGFFSYVPTSILLGKSSPVWLGYGLITVIIFFIINQFAWKRALKHYSSASS